VGKQIEILSEKLEHNVPDPLEGIVGGLLGGIPLIGSALEPEYRYIIHTDKGDFVGEGKTPEEAKAAAWAELQRQL
jgi:hypothetical protein